MASLTLKNIPDPLLDRLRERAASDRRSLTQEIFYLLEEALAGRAPELAALEEEARSQAAAWSELAGRWRSDVDTDEEIEAILASRSRGRDVEL